MGSNEGCYRGTTWPGTGSAYRVVCVFSQLLKWIKLEQLLVVYAPSLLFLLTGFFQVISWLQPQTVLQWISFYNTESFLQLSFHFHPSILLLSPQCVSNCITCRFSFIIRQLVFWSVSCTVVTDCNWDWRRKKCYIWEVLFLCAFVSSSPNFVYIVLSVWEENEEGEGTVHLWLWSTYWNWKGK